MMAKPVFEGLVYDEEGNPVEVRWVGDEPCYVVYDPWGMAYHIPTEQVDRQVLEMMRNLMEGNETQVAQAMAQFLGQDDPFSVALLEQEVVQRMDEHLEALLHLGLPENARYLLGMMGFRIYINHHGDVVHVEWPAAPEDIDDLDPDLDDLE